MKTYTPEELTTILSLHAKWLLGESGGICANLHDANLRDADLRYANLRGANLSGAKYGERAILRAPMLVIGARYTVEEHWSGIRIGCEVNVTSDNLAQLFEKHGTPESMRPLYIAAVKLIEDYAKAWPLLSTKKEDQ